jgi:hypothetical protein
MPIDESIAFVPVRIAVLTVTDTRDVSNDTSGDTLAARIERRKLRRMAIRRIGKGERWRGAESDTPFADGALGPRTALALLSSMSTQTLRDNIVARLDEGVQSLGETQWVRMSDPENNEFCVCTGVEW